MILSTADTDLEQRVLVQLIRAGIEDTFIAYYKIHRNVLPPSFNINRCRIERKTINASTFLCRFQVCYDSFCSKLV